MLKDHGSGVDHSADLGSGLALLKIAQYVVAQTLNLVAGRQKIAADGRLHMYTVGIFRLNQTDLVQASKALGEAKSTHKHAHSNYPSYEPSPVVRRSFICALQAEPGTCDRYVVQINIAI